jgi:hypothetical protein
MILLSMLLIAALIAGAGLIVRLVFKYNEAWLNRVVIMALCLMVMFGASCIIGVSVCSEEIADLRSEYNHIMIYYDVVNQCENEYVRFDFYQEIRDYNVAYAMAVKSAASPWKDVFYPDNWQEQILPIEFYLRTGAEGSIG